MHKRVGGEVYGTPGCLLRGGYKKRGQYWQRMILSIIAFWKDL